MTKEKIINYAMSTPHNTNEAVLGAIIDQHNKEILNNAGFVKTVNGQGPDEQGNVEVDGLGGDILETTTVSEPNIVYDMILEESKWGFLGKVLEYQFDVTEQPFKAGDTCEVTFNGITYQGVIEDSNGYSPLFRWAGTDNTYLEVQYFPDYSYVLISTGGLYQNSMGDIPFVLSNGTIERTETKVKQEYLPAMPLFVHFKPMDDSYEVNHTYDEIVNIIKAGGSVVATMSQYGAVIKYTYQIDIPDDVNEIAFRFNGAQIFLKSDNTIEYAAEA